MTVFIGHGDLTTPSAMLASIATELINMQNDKRASYKIFDNVFSVENIFLEDFFTLALSKKVSYIFQHNAKNGQDKKRVQLGVLDVSENTRQSYAHITSGIEEIFNHIGNYTVFPPNIIISKPNCAQQDFHSDFDFHNSQSRNCFAILVGLQPSTLEVNLICGDKDVPHTISYDAGDIVVLRGDLIHAGSAYINWNARLHYFVEPHGSNSRVDGKIYLYNSDQPQLSIGHYIRITQGEANILKMQKLRETRIKNITLGRKALQLKRDIGRTSNESEVSTQKLTKKKKRPCC